MMCGPVRDSPGGKVRKIVAAGGGWFRGGGPLNIVEVYDISLNTWETGVYDNDHIKGNLGREDSQMSTIKLTHLYCFRYQSSSWTNVSSRR